MPLTLGLTGMDPATETALKAAFIHANARVGSLWQLVPETEADHVMVDMDSMYGPMSWLRLHAAGKHVIGLTTAQRTQTDFRLGRPFDSDSFSTLLRDIATRDGVAVTESPVETAPAAASPPPAADTGPATTPAATAPTESVVDAPAGTPTEPAAIAQPTPAVAESVPSPAAPRAAVADPTPEAAIPREQRLGDWLAPGALSRRVRYRIGDGTSVLIDPAARSYHGPAALKTLVAGFEGVVQRDDFEELDDADWARESAAAGAAQPLQRLQWLGALLAGNGALLPGHDPDGRYRLNKWPQTEREYPKHFRIATAMMKGPATLPEIAEASGMPVADVADFVNASLVTGFADLVPDPPVEPVEPPKSTGLFGRLRGK
jgi:hypothetical protein